MFAGLQKTSLVDYPGKIVATLFTQGCNFGCEYCHNKPLIEIPNILNNKYLIERSNPPFKKNISIKNSSLKKDIFIKEQEIFDFLDTRINILDGICISGGEPTLWGNDLILFIKKIRKRYKDKYLIKLDTNGSNPYILEEIVNLIDFIAVDFKSLNYKLFSNIDKCIVKKSINIAKKCEDYQVRITMYDKYIKEEDIPVIKTYLNEYEKIKIQEVNYGKK